jgi:hypothetical protein
MRCEVNLFLALTLSVLCLKLVLNVTIAGALGVAGIAFSSSSVHIGTASICVPRTGSKNNQQIVRPKLTSRRLPRSHTEDWISPSKLSKREGRLCSDSKLGSGSSRGKANDFPIWGTDASNRHKTDSGRKYTHEKCYSSYESNFLPLISFPHIDRLSNTVICQCLG